MNAMQLLKSLPNGPFEIVVNGITFSGTHLDGVLNILKVKVGPETVANIVLSHLFTLGVNVGSLTYHEFNESRPDYDSYQFEGITYEHQTKPERPHAAAQ